MPTKLKVSTNQEAFDAAVRHLKTLKSRSMSKDGRCEYGGTHCAVGALLEHPDAVENIAIGALAKRGSVDVGEVSVSLLQDLQAAHDCAEHWWSYGYRDWFYLEAIGTQYKLDTSVVPD